MKRPPSRCVSHFSRPRRARPLEKLARDVAAFSAATAPEK